MHHYRTVMSARGNACGDEGREMAEKMQAVVCHGPRDYRFEERPRPVAGPGGALVRVEAVGICGSDLKCFQGAGKFWGDDAHQPWAQRDVIPGHEFVAVVVDLDEQAAQRWQIQPGDRVVSEQIVPCWECDYCRRGQYWLCLPHDIYGFRRRTQGAMASHMVFPSGALVHKISAALPAAVAAFAEPLSCALHAVERAELRFTDVVVVAGCGPIGLGAVAGAAAKSPAHVLALDTSDERLGLAKRCGAATVINIGREDPGDTIAALTGGYGADVYIDTAGHPSAVPQGLRLLRKQGRFVEYSVFSADVTVDWTIISDDKELNVRGAHLGPSGWPAAIRMLESGLLPMDSICSTQLPLAQFQHGLDLVADGSQSVKVSLIP